MSLSLSISQPPTEELWCWPHSKLVQTIGWRWILQEMEMAGIHLHNSVVQQDQLTAVTDSAAVTDSYLF